MMIISQRVMNVEQDMSLYDDDVTGSDDHKASFVAL